jgi:hypothetical protein
MDAILLIIDIVSGAFVYKGKEGGYVRIIVISIGKILVLSEFHEHLYNKNI